MGAAVLLLKHVNCGHESASNAVDPGGNMAQDSLRVPPQNLDAERGVLGSIMLLNEAIDDVGEILKPDHFYSDGHQKIYTAIRDLYENNVRGIDAITLAEELVRRDELEDIGGAAYLGEILEAVPHAAHVRYYSNIVRQKWNPDGNQRDDFLAKLDQVAKLRELVPGDSTMIDFALQFVLANPAVTCPIPGMKTPDQARQNAGASEGKLNPEILDKIDAICPPSV